MATTSSISINQLSTNISFYFDASEHLQLVELTGFGTGVTSPRSLFGFLRLTYGTPVECGDGSGGYTCVWQKRDLLIKAEANSVFVTVTYLQRRRERL